MTSAQTELDRSPPEVPDFDAPPTVTENPLDAQGAPTGRWVVARGDSVFVATYQDGRASGRFVRFVDARRFEVGQLVPRPDLLPNVLPLETATDGHVDGAAFWGRAGSVCVGRWIVLHPGGAVLRAIEFDDSGLPHGLWREWDAAGQLVRHETHERGFLTGRAWRWTGKKLVATEYRHGAPVLAARSLGPVLRSLFSARDVADVGAVVEPRGGPRLLWVLAGQGLLQPLSRHVCDHLRLYGEPRQAEVAAFLLRSPAGVSANDAKRAGLGGAVGRHVTSWTAGRRAALAARLSGGVRQLFDELRKTCSDALDQLGEPVEDAWLDAALEDTAPPAEATAEAGR